MTPGQKKYAKHADDPMVTFHPVALSVAIQERGLTPGAVASRLEPRQNRQTLHAMVRGAEVRRCRRSCRRSLAALLDVPEPWLAGDVLTQPALLLEWGLTYLVYARSPRVLFALMQLRAQVQAAAKRDAVKADTARPPDEVATEVMELVSELSTVERWRVTLLTGTGGRPWVSTARPAVAKTPPTPVTDAPTEPLTLSAIAKSAAALLADVLANHPLTPAEEDATLALLKAISYTLEPWLSGSAQLRLDRLSAIAALVAPPYAKPPADVPNVTVGATRPRKPRK